MKTLTFKDIFVKYPHGFLAREDKYPFAWTDRDLNKYVLQAYPDQKYKYCLKTGHPYEDGYLIVLDCDIHRPEQKGDVIAAEIAKHSDTLTVRTKGGGTHFYFVVPSPVAGMKNAHVSMEGLDIQAHRVFVFCPPTANYTVINNAPIQPLPDAVRAFIKPEALDPPSTKQTQHRQSQQAEQPFADVMREALVAHGWTLTGHQAHNELWRRPNGSSGNKHHATFDGRIFNMFSNPSKSANPDAIPEGAHTPEDVLKHLGEEDRIKTKVISMLPETDEKIAQGQSSATKKKDLTVEDMLIPHDNSICPWLAPYIEPLQRHAFNEPMAVWLCVMFPYLSTILGNRVKLFNDAYKSDPIIWSMLFAESGTGKSPFVGLTKKFRALVEERLAEILESRISRYNSLEANIRGKLAYIQNELKKKSVQTNPNKYLQLAEEQVKLKKRLSSFKDKLLSLEMVVNYATEQGIITQLASSPRAVLLELDEIDALRSLIASKSQINASLRSFLSSAYSNEGISKALKSEVVRLESTLTNQLACAQPSLMADWFQSQEFAQGFVYRYNCCAVKQTGRQHRTASISENLIEGIQQIYLAVYDSTDDYILRVEMPAKRPDPIILTFKDSTRYHEHLKTFDSGRMDKEAEQKFGGLLGKYEYLLNSLIIINHCLRQASEYVMAKDIGAVEEGTHMVLETEVDDITVEKSIEQAQIFLQTSMLIQENVYKTKPKKRMINQSAEEKILSFVKDGMTSRELTRKFNKSFRDMEKIISADGWEIRKEGKKKVIRRKKK